MSDSRVVQAGGAPTASPSEKAGAGQPAPASSEAGAAAAAAEPASTKIHTLMRREAAAVKRELEAKSTEEKLKAREEALAAREAKLREMDDLWEKNPREAIKSRGLDPLQLALQQDGQPMTPEVKISLLERQVQSLLERLDKDRADGEAREKAKADAAAADEERQWEADLAKFVESNKEKFPFLNAYNRVDLVKEAIEDHFEKTLKETGVGEEMDLEKASAQIEAALRAEVQKGQELLQKADPGSAVKPGEAPPSAVRRTVPESQRWVERPVVKTLAGVQSVTPSQPQRFLSDQERMERAAQRLRELRARTQG